MTSSIARIIQVQSMIVLTGGLFAAGITPAAAAVDELVVTATKRDKSIKDVPISMTVLSAEELEVKTVVTLTDITASASNVLFTEPNNSEGSNSFNIRGLTTTFNNSGISPGTGVYVDGVYLARNVAFESALFDLERVEVLKGPQGTLFGKNTIHGAISVVTADPTNEFEAIAGVQIGNYDLYQIRGTVSGPIVKDRFSARVSGYVRDRDGFVEDTFRNTTLNGQEYYGGRAKLLFAPTENLDIELSFDAQKDDTSANTNDEFPIDYVVQTSGDPQVFEREVFGGSMEINYDLSGYGLTSITAYRSVDHRFVADQDYTTLQILDNTFRNEQVSWFSEELRIASPTNEKFDWLAGLYIFRQWTDTRTFAEFGPDFFPFFPLITDTRAEHEIKSEAIFADGNWHITDRLTLNGGIRYTWEDQVFDYEQISNVGLVAPGAFPMIAPFTQELSSSEISATAGLLWDITEDVTAYGKYTRGFKSGGFNTSLAVATADEIRAVRPEFIDSFEIGLKGFFFDGNLSANFAVFYLDYKDRQVNAFINAINGFTFVNAAASTSWGFEADFAAQPFEGLDLALGVGFNDGEFDEFPDCLGPGTDCSGQPLGSPNFNLSGSIQYTHSMTDWLDAYGRIDGYWQEKPDVNSIGGSTGIPTPDRTLINGRLGVLSPEGDWELALWVKNLTKDDFTIFTEAFTGQPISQLPDPRTYGVEAIVRF